MEWFQLGGVAVFSQQQLILIASNLQPQKTKFPDLSLSASCHYVQVVVPLAACTSFKRQSSLESQSRTLKEGAGCWVCSSLPSAQHQPLAPHLRMTTLQASSRFVALLFGGGLL